MKNVKIPITILHDSHHFLVVNKPPFVLSQPLNKYQTNIKINTQPIIQQLNYPEPLFPIHRLDYNVSGCLCFGKTKIAAQNFHKFLKQGDKSSNKGFPITRNYFCLTKPLLKDIPLNKSGTVETIINESKAISHYEMIKKFANNNYLLKFSLITGKKHQIKKHVHELGLSILGDSKEKTLMPIALHAGYMRIKIGLKVFEIFAPINYNHNGIWNDLISNVLVEKNGKLSDKLNMKLREDWIQK